MSLAELYADAWRKKYGWSWVPNFDPKYPIALGNVGRSISDEKFAYESTVGQRGIAAPAIESEEEGADSSWSFQTSSDIAVNFVANAQGEPPIAWLGNAQVGIDVSFGKRAGVSIHGQSRRHRRYANMTALRDTVIDAAEQGKIHQGEAVVVEVQLSGPGVQFVGSGKNASLKVPLEASAPKVGVPLVELNGKLGIARDAVGAFFREFTGGSVVGYRALRLGKKGWFWWRRWDVAGFIADGDDPAEEFLRPQEGDQPDTYFALLH